MAAYFVYVTRRDPAARVYGSATPRLVQSHRDLTHDEVLQIITAVQSDYGSDFIAYACPVCGGGNATFLSAEDRQLAESGDPRIKVRKYMRSSPDRCVDHDKYLDETGIAPYVTYVRCT